jgi:acyl carrier protein
MKQAEKSSMNTSDVYAFIAATIANELKMNAHELTPTTELRAVDGVESIKVLRIISKVEQKYDVELDDDTVFRVNTIQDIVDAVCQRDSSKE